MKKINQKKILITSGDPHGVGVEIILKTLTPTDFPYFLIIGSKNIYDQYQQILNIDKPIHILKDISSEFDPQKLNILEIPYDHEIHPGILSPYAGGHAINCLDASIDLIKKDFSKILITAPVNKEAIAKSIPHFIGHTEYLADHFQIPKVTMLMASHKFNVALVTTHHPLSEVSNLLSIENISTTIFHANQFLLSQGINKPSIAVCGLNPHAGEGGKIGHEESDLIIPAINKTKSLGINAQGPFPADGLFAQIHENPYDIYIAMYHDQGLIPFKVLSFHNGVNITLGLPFHRISVDHGTAFNIAGKGIANTNSLKEAMHRARIIMQNI